MGFRRGLVPGLLSAAAVCSMLLVAGPAFAQIGYAVDSDINGDLYRIDLSTGDATLIGNTGASDIEGLAFHPTTGVLFGVDDDTGALFTCDTSTGACSFVGDLGISTFNPGLAFSCEGVLYLTTQDDPGSLYVVDPGTGAASLVGTFGSDIDGNGIAFGPPSAACASGAYIVDGDPSPPDLLCVDLGTGAATLIGSLVAPLEGQPGIDFDVTGTLWAVEDDPGVGIYRVNTTTGVATYAGYDLSAGTFDNLAITPGFCARQAAPLPAPAMSSGMLIALLVALLAVAFVGLRRFAGESCQTQEGAA